MSTVKTFALNSEKLALGLYGASGFGREVMPLIREYVEDLKKSNGKLICTFYFIDDNPESHETNGVKIISSAAFFELDCEIKLFNIAIGNSKIREFLANQCIERGAEPLSLLSSRALIYDHNQIGCGAILCANSIITSNAKIGKFFQSNIYSYVAHDCVIGDYVTFAPNVHCNGNVHIHDHAYIGTGAILRQGTPEKPLIIGEGAVVGMGAVVTKDVPAHTTVVGNPARIYQKD